MRPEDLEGMGGCKGPKAVLDYVRRCVPFPDSHHHTFLVSLTAPLEDMSKRAAPQEEGTLIKRARSSEPEASNQQQLVISSSNDERQKALIRSVKRTSNLEAPIVSLSGAHGVRFHGQCLLGT
jgi:hypothetical protein